MAVRHGMGAYFLKQLIKPMIRTLPQAIDDN